MREQDHLAALVGDLRDRRRDARDARCIGDLAVLHRHVEVDAHEHALAGEICLIERFEGRHARPAMPWSSLRAEGEAIQSQERLWIASSLSLLAMTRSA